MSLAGILPTKYKEIANMENILVADAARYVGQYVTTADFGKTEVITSSKSAVEAYNNAKELGYTDPVLIYVPLEGE